MRYQQPYGVSDPNAGYINGNPATGQAGSIPPAAAFEQPMREIVSVIAAGDLVPSDTDLAQLLKSNRRQRYNFAVDTGTQNNLVVSLNPPLDAYHQGMPLRVLVANDCAGPSNINVDGNGIRAIKRSDGSDTSLGDMKAGMVVNLIDTGTVFQLQNPLIGAATTANTFQVDIPYCADSSLVANTVIAVFSPAITAISEGKYIAVKINNTNTAASVMAVNALPQLPICRSDGSNVQPGDLVKGEAVLFENHGTYYQMVGLCRSQVMLQPAPALRGLVATQWGASGVLIAPAVTTRIPFQTILKNSMQTSTWDGQTLRIGAGEGGMWQVYAAMHLSQVSQDCNIQMSIVQVNGQNTLGGTVGFMDQNTGSVPTVAGNIMLNPGDKVESFCYHQTGGGVNQLTVADPWTRFSAFLTST